MIILVNFPVLKISTETNCNLNFGTVVFSAIDLVNAPLMDFYVATAAATGLTIKDITTGLDFFNVGADLFAIKDSLFENIVSCKSF